MNQFYGKYRGKVENNTDPEMRGRIQVSVPAVYGEGRLNWALPCTPYGGDGVGFFAIPPVGANVWVEFEAGDPNSAIWSGCFWDQGQAPASPAVAMTKVLKTDQVTMTFDLLTTGTGLTIETAAGAKIVLNEQGIELSTQAGGSIKIQGPQVSINNGALEVV